VNDERRYGKTIWKKEEKHRQDEERRRLDLEKNKNRNGGLDGRIETSFGHTPKKNEGTMRIKKDEKGFGREGREIIGKGSESNKERIYQKQKRAHTPITTTISKKHRITHRSTSTPY